MDVTNQLPSLVEEEIVVKKVHKKLESKACLSCGIVVCEVCDICETVDCLYAGKKIISKKDLVAVKYLYAKTQKARGFVALSEEGFTVPNPFFVVQDDEDIDGLIFNSFANEVFVRPCPVRPRHGFVESRGVKQMKQGFEKNDIHAEIRSIFNEARENDPEAELLILPKIHSTHNLIITPTRLAVGKGHDGATSGKGSVSIPLSGVPFPTLTDKLLKRASVDITKDDPYLEVVMALGSYGNYFTQLRAGVKIAPTVGKDYIPKTFRVSAVVEASGDLLEWEKQVKTLDSTTAVYHLGGTLVSHYGVHCMYNGIPILTSRIPVVGEILEATAVMEWPDPSAVIKGLAIGAQLPIDTDNIGRLVKFLLPISHNAAAMKDGEGVWLGVATSIMLRAGMAASHGEARHATIDRGGRAKTSRPAVYQASFKEFFATRNMLGRAQWLFQNYKWGGSFGGKAWAACTQSVLELDTVIRELMISPEKDQVSAVISSLHKAINQAHNGGWWLNKFVEQYSFDFAARQELGGLIEAAPGLMDIHLFMQKLDSTCVDNTITQWRDAGEIDVVMPTYMIGSEYDHHHGDGPIVVIKEVSEDFYDEDSPAEVIDEDLPSDFDDDDDSIPPTEAEKQIAQDKHIQELKASIAAKIAANKAAKVSSEPIKSASKLKNYNGAIIPPDVQFTKFQVYYRHGDNGQLGIHYQFMLTGNDNGYFSGDYFFEPKTKPEWFQPQGSVAAHGPYNVPSMHPQSGERYYDCMVTTSKDWPGWLLASDSVNNIMFYLKFNGGTSWTIHTYQEMLSGVK